MARKKKNKDVPHEVKRAQARAAGNLRKYKGSSWDRRVSKKQRSKIYCRKKDPRKGGAL
jgi:hypothetical protein